MSASPRILLFDRRSSSTERIAAALTEEGYAVEWIDESERARARLREEDVEVVLGELAPSGGDVLAEALALPDGPELILFEGFDSVAADFAAIRRSAFETLAQPVNDEDVLRVVRRALEHRALVQDNRRLRTAVAERFELGNLVSRDPRMGRIFDTLSAVADSRANLMLSGESGTGKTVLARAIHGRSGRAEQPFIAVNCGAIPETLLESELFGHVRGAFTGAVKDREGKFEAADGGTIFLDEIGTASHELQVKLLRVIEEGRFERVGETTTREVDARLIAATNANLEAEVEAGRFRADLFYRINVVGVELPPLRSRVIDIPLLSERFVERFAERHERAVAGFTADAMRRLCAHTWPGNVRELENTIERAVLLAGGPTLTPHDLWPADADPSATLTAAAPAMPRSTDAPLLEDLPIEGLKESLGHAERWLILRTLRAFDGNRQRTAKALEINRTTLFNKMRKYDLLSFPTSLESPDSPDITSDR